MSLFCARCGRPKVIRYHAGSAHFVCVVCPPIRTYTTNSTAPPAFLNPLSEGTEQ